RRRSDDARPRPRPRPGRDPALPADPSGLRHPPAGPRYGRADRPVRHARGHRHRQRGGVAGQRPAPGPADAMTALTRPGARLAELSSFFPAHNEAANLRGLVEEALETLPELAETFEIVIVDDGSKDETPAIADELAAAHSEVRAVHHPTNLGYGAALRSGF